MHSFKLHAQEFSTDNQFDKPVLSTPQANALLKVLRKENIDEYLEIPHWL